MRAVLLVSCPAVSGLVTKLTGFIYGHGGDITHVDHHLDHDMALSFSRIEWNLEHFSLAPEEIESALTGVACCVDAAWRFSISSRAPRVAIWVSRQDHCLLDLLSRQRAGELRVKIPVIMSNHPDLQPLATQFGIDYRHYPITAENQAAQERLQLAALREQDIELVVLARYMRILGPEIVNAFRQRIINIHHAFLPAFAGADPYERAHVRGVKLVGATAHYVTAALDEGPIIEQDVIRVTHRDSRADLIFKGRDMERVVLARAVRFHLENRVGVSGNKTVVFA
ncbi:MAG: formyltetrahydrofolate deformylase [Verrucomicrobia bacterium SCN 57-15]|nr:MAG: formyltetrahydrofolate deformylase [Verrucomicrobia bacterium SCN 57-15]